jgi:hypothetical protein
VPPQGLQRARKEGDGDGVNNGESNEGRVTATRSMVAESRKREKMVRARGRRRISAGRMTNGTRTTERARVTRTTAETSMTARRRRGQRSSVLVVVLSLDECVAEVKVKARRHDEDGGDEGEGRQHGREGSTRVNTRVKRQTHHDW